MTSPTTYPEFYARDFGRTVPSLLACGFDRWVESTFEYAFKHYESEGHFTLIISPSGKCFDFPSYSPDGFAYFLHGMSCLNDPWLVKRHRTFLEREIERFYHLVLDSDKLVRKETLFSEAQDYAHRNSSCYSNSVCLLIQRSLISLGLFNPLEDIDFSSQILKHFWRTDHFMDDLKGDFYPSGDAQIMPFLVGLKDDSERTRLNLVIPWMEKTGLLDPMPARYGISSHPKRKMLPLETFHAWQTDAVWTSLGLDYLAILKKFKHPSFLIQLKQYQNLIERLSCFPEVIDSKSKTLFQSSLIETDDSMIWAASLLNLLKTNNLYKTKKENA